MPATERQMESIEQDRRAYDLNVRPELMARAIAKLQAAGIEPDVWKLEGWKSKRRPGLWWRRPAPVDGMLLVSSFWGGGRMRRVGIWLATGAQTEGVIGVRRGADGVLAAASGPQRGQNISRRCHKSDSEIL